MPSLHALKLATPLAIRNTLRPFAYAVEKRLQARRLRAFYAPFLRPGDVVFDIGAHLGEHSEHFLALGAEKVVGVEPSPYCRTVLEDLSAREYRFRYIQAAVGAEPGTATLHIPPVPAYATLNLAYQEARFPNVDFPRTETVQVETLQRLVAQHGTPDFVKVDVEGSELAVLEGMSLEPALRPKFMSFEFCLENKPAAAQCLNLCGSRAKYNVSLYANHRLHFKDWLSQRALFFFLDEFPDQHLCGDIVVRFP